MLNKQPWIAERSGPPTWGFDVGEKVHTVKNCHFTIRQRGLGLVSHSERMRVLESRVEKNVWTAEVGSKWKLKKIAQWEASLILLFTKY
jgi:hypothetical protein